METLNFDTKIEKDCPFVTVYVSDGTILKVKLEVIAVTRTDQYDQLTGNPLYAISSTNIVRTTKVPHELRKKQTKEDNQSYR